MVRLFLPQAIWDFGAKPGSGCRGAIAYARGGIPTGRQKIGCTIFYIAANAGFASKLVSLRLLGVIRVAASNFAAEMFIQ